jgi:hypothetical protein
MAPTMVAGPVALHSDIPYISYSDFGPYFGTTVLGVLIQPPADYLN